MIDASWLALTQDARKDKSAQRPLAMPLARQNEKLILEYWIDQLRSKCVFVSCLIDIITATDKH